MAKLTDLLKDEFDNRKKNLLAWGEVATSPKLRQEFNQQVIKPQVQKITQPIQRYRIKIATAPQRIQGRVLQKAGQAGQRAQQFFGLKDEAKFYQQMPKGKPFTRERIARNIMPIYSARKTALPVAAAVDTIETLGAGGMRAASNIYKSKGKMGLVPAIKEGFSSELKEGAGFTGGLQSMGVPKKLSYLGLIGSVLTPGPADIRKGKVVKEAAEEGIEKLAKEARKYKSAEEFISEDYAKSGYSRTNNVRELIDRAYEKTISDRPLGYLQELMVNLRDRISSYDTAGGKPGITKSKNLRATGYEFQGLQTGLDNVLEQVERKKSQLTDIYNQTTKGVKPSSVIPEVGGVKVKAPEAKLVTQISEGQSGKPQKPLMSLESALKVSGESGGEVYAPSKLLKTPAESAGQVIPSTKIVPQTEKYAANVNLERLVLNPREKQVLRTTVDSVKPALEKIKGKTLSNKEVLEAAKKSEILTKVTTRDETLAAEAATLKARQRLTELDKSVTRLAESGNVKQLKTEMTDLVESLRVVSGNAADAGRKLQSLSIEAGDVSIRQTLLKEIGKTEAETAKIVEEAAKVNWNDTNSITAFYRKFVKPTTMEVLDEYRYNNMLSNPRTHIRNAFSNLVQTFFTRPATLAASGRPVEAVQYYSGALKSLPKAVDDFVASFKGTSPITKPDIAYIGTKKLPKFLTIPTRAMEAADKFFSAMIEGGELARGATVEQATKTAEYSLFRQGLFPEDQGKLLNAIDSMTAWTYKAPKAVRWFVPFIRTPMNFAKQWIEYSPAGLATLPGVAAKREQLGKVLVGSAITAIGAKFALDDNTTWDTPTDPEQKELFYASGKKPFSVRVGDKWVPMMYAGPFAVAFALPAAMKYYQDQSRTALTDSQLDKATQVVGSMAKFLSGQTFLEGINNFVRLLSGDIDYSLPSNLAFSAGQVIPLEGLVRYVSTIVDPIYRKGTSFTEGLKKNIPFASKTLEPYTNPIGEPSTRERINLITPYDITTSQPQWEQPLQQRTEKLQQNAVINKMKKDYEQGTKLSTIGAQAATEGEDIEITKARFRYSDKTFGIIGDNVFRKTKDGSVTSTPINAYKKQVADAMYPVIADKAKRSGDVNGWLVSTAQYLIILNQYKETLDPDTVDYYTVDNKMNDLLASFGKYQGYRGFTKPKTVSGGGINTPTLKITNYIAPRPTVRIQSSTRKPLKVEDYLK